MGSTGFFYGVDTIIAHGASLVSYPIITHPFLTLTLERAMKVKRTQFTLIS